MSQLFKDDPYSLSNNTMLKTFEPPLIPDKLNLLNLDLWYRQAIYWFFQINQDDIDPHLRTPTKLPEVEGIKNVSSQ